MPNVTTFPNGQILTSSALSQNDINVILQAITCASLGIDPTVDPLAFSKVRIAWIAQPAFTRFDDVCSISATEVAGAYSTLRDRVFSPNSSSTVLQTDTYTRIWQTHWMFSGPNSYDHARLLKSALTLDFTHDTLLASALTVINANVATTRAPELFEGEWWDRSDVQISLYELVTETLAVASIASAEALVFTVRGQVADIKAHA